jgi:hypothetical protein
LSRFCSWGPGNSPETRDQYYPLGIGTYGEWSITQHWCTSTLVEFLPKSWSLTIFGQTFRWYGTELSALGRVWTQVIEQFLPSSLAEFPPVHIFCYMKSPNHIRYSFLCVSRMDFMTGYSTEMILIS